MPRKRPEHYIPRTVYERQAREHTLLDNIWTIYGPVGEEHRVSRSDAAGALGTSTSNFDIAIRKFERGGMARRRYTWDDQGRVSYLTLIMSQEGAHTALNAIHAEELKEIDKPPVRRKRKTSSQMAVEAVDAGWADAKTEPVALAKSDAEELRATAGPEAESPLKALAPYRKLDDPEAAVALARQYKDRHKTVLARLDDLASIAAEYGISFDRAKMTDAIKVEVDPMMEAIVAILPYIDRLEGRVKSLGSNAADARDKVQKYDAMVREVERLRDQNRRLIAEKVSAAQASQNFRND